MKCFVKECGDCMRVCVGMRECVRVCEVFCERMWGGVYECIHYTEICERKCECVGEEFL